MAEGQKKGGRRGHRVKSSRALRYLFASGILTGSGGKGGKARKVTYNRKRAQSIRKAAGGAASSAGKGKGSGGRKASDSTVKRTVVGGKSAHLRGAGTGSGSKKRMPSKAQRDKTRGERIALGREKAQAFMGSHKGQLIRDGVTELAATKRRTGRRDYDKPKKVKAAKDKLREAGVKIKTGEALAQRGAYGNARLRGDWSGKTYVKDAPKYAREKAAAKRRQERAAKREAIIAPIRGKSRAERIAYGKFIAKNSPEVRQFELLKEAKARSEARQKQEAERQTKAAARDQRLSGRRKREQRRKAAERAAQVARWQATARRSESRERRQAGAERVQRQLSRQRRIAAGRAVYAEFDSKRRSAYNTLF